MVFGCHCHCHMNMVYKYLQVLLYEVIVSFFSINGCFDCIGCLLSLVLCRIMSEKQNKKKKAGLTKKMWDCAPLLKRDLTTCLNYFDIVDRPHKLLHHSSFHSFHTYFHKTNNNQATAPAIVTAHNNQSKRSVERTTRIKGWRLIDLRARQYLKRVFLIEEGIFQL